MLNIIFVSCFVFSSFILSGTAKAEEFYPNDLSKIFKSTGKMQVKNITLNGRFFEAKIDPLYSKPMLALDVPAAFTDQNAINQFAVSELNQNFSVKLEEVNAHLTNYGLYYLNERIASAWVKVQCISPDEEKKCLIAFKLPASSAPPVRFKAEEGFKATGFTLIDRKIVEYAEIKNLHNKSMLSQSVRVVFPADSKLEPKTVVTLVAETKSNAKMETFKLPKGTFPDCVQVDKKDRVWLTQPSDDLLTMFDPEQNQWTHKKVGRAPDGLWMDRGGQLWFGEYSGAAIGFFDPAADTYKQYTVPYSPSAPAIPFEDRNGIIWTSDHQNNRVIKLDPKQNLVESFLVPKGGVWLVELTQTTASDDILFTEVYANRIGRLKRDLSSYDFIDLRTSDQPAFFEPDQEFLWISLWGAGGFMKLNTSNNELVEYKIEDKAAPCTGLGPISIGSKGQVFLGCRGNNRVYQYNPTSGKLDWAEGSGQLKDGAAVDSHDRFWVTDMGSKITRTTFE